jgi:hypothetical protein
MSNEKPFSVSLVGTNAAPAIPMSDPEREAKVAKWRREQERDEQLRMLNDLRRGRWE